MPQKPVSPWLVLSLVCLAQFMVVLDATIVNVALPSIQADLKMAEGDPQWIVNWQIRQQVVGNYAGRDPGEGGRWAGDF